MNEDSRKKLQNESPDELIERIGRYLGMIHGYRRKIEASDLQIQHLSKHNEELTTKAAQQSQSIDLLSQEKEIIGIRNAKLEVRLKQFLHEKKETTKSAIANMTDFDSQQEIYKLQQENRHLRQMVKSKEDELSQCTADSSFVDPYNLDPIRLGSPTHVTTSSSKKSTIPGINEKIKLDEDAVGAATQLISTVAKDLNSWWFGGSSESTSTNQLPPHQHEKLSKQQAQAKTPSKLESASSRRQREQNRPQNEQFLSPQHHNQSSKGNINDIVSLHTPARSNNHGASTTSPDQFSSFSEFSDILGTLNGTSNGNDNDEGDHQLSNIPSVQFDALLGGDDFNSTLSTIHTSPSTQHKLQSTSDLSSDCTPVIDLFESFASPSSSNQTNQTRSQVHPPSDTENEFGSLQERFSSVERELSQLTNEIDDLKSSHQIELSGLKYTYESKLTEYSTNNNQSNILNDELNIKYNKLNDKFLQLSQTYETLQQTLFTLQSDHNILTKESQILQTTLSDAESTIIRLQQQSNTHALSSSHQMDELAKQHTQLQHSFNQLQLEFNSSQNQCNTINDKYQTTTKQLAISKAQHDQLQTLYLSSQDKTTELQQQLDQMHQQRDQLTKHVEALREQLEQADSATNDTADLLSKHHAEIESITSSLTTSYEAKLLQFRTELKMAQTQSQVDHAQLENMQNERVTALELELDQMKLKLEQAQTPLQQALNNLSKLYNENEKLKFDREIILLERNQFEESNTGLKTQFNCLKIDFDDATIKLNKANIDSANYSALLTQLQSTNEAFDSQHQLDVTKYNKLEQTNAELLNQLASLRVELDSVLSASTQSEQVVDTLHNQIQALNDTISSLQTTRQTQENEYNQLLERLHKAEQNQTQRQAEFGSQLSHIEEQYKMQLSTVQSQSETMSFDYQSLQQELELINAECQSLRDELSTVHGQNTANETQFTELQETLSKQLQDMTDLYTVSQKENLQMQKINITLKEDLAEIDSKYYNLASQFKQTNEQHQNTISSLQQELSMVNVEHDAFKSEMHALNDNVHQSRVEIDSLRAELNISNETTQDQSNTIALTMKQKEELQEQFLVVQNQLNKVEKKFADIEGEYLDLKTNATSLTSTDLALLQASISRYIVSNGDDHQFLFPSICTILELNSAEITLQRDEYKKNHTSFLAASTSAATWSSFLSVGSDFLNSTIHNLQQQNDSVVNNASTPASPRQGQEQ